MSVIKIETLTPVHIGNGKFLYNNADFISDGSGDDFKFIVVSPDKIGKLFGSKGQNFIDKWLIAIQTRTDIREFIKTFAPNAIPFDYEDRTIIAYSNAKPNDTLKEQIHNGMGLPYIPGSSIKGAIRTALLARKATNITINNISTNGKLSAAKIEKEYFGSDPNNDVFRFIQVGDAYFQKGAEIATRMINLNIRKGNEDLQDNSKPQLVEAIGQDVISEFNFKIANDKYDLFAKKTRGAIHLPADTIQKIFSTINAHTKKLLEKEIDLWKEWSKRKDDGAGCYIEELKNILDKITDNNNSCILRIGHASGWRFITGAWTEQLQQEDFDSYVVPAARAKNDKYYAEYRFPKTRRLDEEGYIFGFVKLTVL